MHTSSQSQNTQVKRPHPPPVAADKAGHWYQYLNRYWLPFLSGAELKIVLFILDQQLGWSNIEPKRIHEVRISRSRFAKGVTAKKNGIIYHAGTGLADSTIDAALRSLEQRDAIHVRRQQMPDRTDCFYSLNWFWVPASPKHSVNNSLARKSGRPARKHQDTPPENRVQRESLGEIFNTQESQSAPCAGPLSSDSKNTSEQGKKTSKSWNILDERRPTAEQIRAVWEKAVLDTFPNAPPLAWRNRQAQALRAYCKQWTENHSETFLRFVDWCVRNWGYIIQTAFPRLEIAPVFPAPLFLAHSSFSSSFELAFAERETQLKELSMTTKERKTQELIRQGYPRDVAARQVEDQMQTGKQLEKLRTATESAQRARQFAKMEINRAQALIRRVPPGRVPQVKAIKVRPVEEIDLSDVPDSFGTY